MISSKDVARASGVSVSTVSRVFSRPEMVNVKTREIVLKVAKEMHYIPDVTAKSLKLNHSNIIGMVISDISNPFYLHAAKELSTSEGCEDKKFFITFSQEDPILELNSVSSLIGSKADIIIFTPCDESKNEVERLITANDVPAIQVYRRKYDNLDSLIIDDAFGTYLATKELIKNGHSNILLYDYQISTPTHREDGYIKAFEEAGIAYNPNNIIKSKFADDFYHVVKQTIEEKKPTAVIPSGNLFIDALRKYLRNNNLKIKDDLSVVSYDDTDISRALNISAISHPFKSITEQLNNIINMRLAEEGDKKPIHLVIKPFFVSRDSIAKIN